MKRELKFLTKSMSANIDSSTILERDKSRHINRLDLVECFNHFRYINRNSFIFGFYSKKGFSHD
jgi:hypothetical protein